MTVRYFPVSDRVKYAQFLHDGSEILIAPPRKAHGQTGELKPVGGLKLPMNKPNQEVPVIEIFL